MGCHSTSATFYILSRRHKGLNRQLIIQVDLYQPTKIHQSRCLFSSRIRPTNSRVWNTAIKLVKISIYSISCNGHSRHVLKAHTWFGNLYINANPRQPRKGLFVGYVKSMLNTCIGNWPGIVPDLHRVDWASSPI